MEFVRYCTAIHQLSVSEMRSENICFKSTAPASVCARFDFKPLQGAVYLFYEQGISSLIGSRNSVYLSITGARDKHRVGGLKGVGDVFMVVCFGNLALF